MQNLLPTPRKFNPKEFLLILRDKLLYDLVLSDSNSAIVIKHIAIKVTQIPLNNNTKNYINY